jgi:hypothetical protein
MYGAKLQKTHGIGRQMRVNFGYGSASLYVKRSLGK